MTLTVAVLVFLPNPRLPSDSQLSNRLCVYSSKDPGLFHVVVIGCIERKQDCPFHHDRAMPGSDGVTLRLDLIRFREWQAARACSTRPLLKKTRPLT